MFTITLYSKEGCHLCEQLLLDLRPLAAQLGFSVQEVDIAADPALWQRFRYLIPVVATPARAFFAPIDTDELRDELMKELQEVQRDANTWPTG